MADQLATPEDLASLLQEDLDRATAELLIECATAVVQRAAGGQRILLVEDDEITIYLDEHDDPYWLTLPQRPVVEVSQVLVGATAVTDWSPQYNRSRIYRLSGWRYSSYGLSTPVGVTITYSHGLDPTDQRIQLARSAVLAFAAQGYTNPTGAQREQIDDYAIQFAAMTTQMEASPSLARSLRQQYGRTGTSVRLVRS